MVWLNDRYFYSIKTIEEIADYWDVLYTDWAASNHYSPIETAEFVADFCIALSKLPFRYKKAVEDYTGGAYINKREPAEKQEDRWKAYRMMINRLNGKED